MTVADDKFQRVLSAFRAGYARDAERLFKAHIAGRRIAVRQCGGIGERKGVVHRVFETSGTEPNDFRHRAQRTSRLSPTEIGSYILRLIES